jgi:hypothetical protein
VAISGSFLILYLYDVCEEIDLPKLRNLAGQEQLRPSALRQAPEYVRFAQAPVIEALAPLQLQSGESLGLQISYFDYGVVSLQLELPFSFDWPDLISLAARWIWAPDLEALAGAALRERLAQLPAALIKPNPKPLAEDYYVIRLDPIVREDGSLLPAEQLLRERRAEIAQVVRGEHLPLSNEEINEVLQARTSYYPTDLTVVGWTAALVYDSQEGAASTIQLLNYANTQLLEFRYYDDVLTQTLSRVYKQLDRGSGLLQRWRLAREAESLNAIRLEVRELSERADTAIKFLSDMFSARQYHLAAKKVGVPDYRNLVDEKLSIASELYEYMNGRFHQSSALLLEAMVVIILIIDLIYLFKGRG